MKRFQRWLGVIGLLCVVVLFVLAIASVSVAATLNSSGGGSGHGMEIGLGLSALFLFGMALSTESNYLSDVLLWEADGQISRKKVTVLSGQNLALGTVLGRIILGAVSETHAGNTGNGVMTLDAATPKLANAQTGVYAVKCITAASNSGTFRVFDPRGNALGDVAVAGTFANQIKFVIADGSADFIVGDTFLVTVAAGSGKVKILTPAALDGTQNAYGVLTAAVDASASDLPGVAIERLATLKSAGLVWPDGISADQKAAALAELEAKHMVARTSA